MYIAVKFDSVMYSSACVPWTLTPAVLYKMRAAHIHPNTVANICAVKLQHTEEEKRLQSCRAEW